jgi:hypothetical protein
VKYILRTDIMFKNVDQKLSEEYIKAVKLLQQAETLEVRYLKLSFLVDICFQFSSKLNFISFLQDLRNLHTLNWTLYLFILN